MSDSRSGLRPAAAWRLVAAVAGACAVVVVPARRAAHVHLPAQAGSEEPLRPARGGQRRHDRSGRLGHELGARVRRLQAHRRSHADAFRRIRDAAGRRRRRPIPGSRGMFAGYAFAIDYRDRRGHAYMLQDQEQTRRVTERPAAGLVPPVPYVGHPDLSPPGRRRRLQGLRGDWGSCPMAKRTPKS